MSEERTGTIVDAHGLSLLVGPESVVDVYFGEQRMFSAGPTKFSTKGGRAHLAWPKVLQQHLSGRTRLVVKEHLSGAVLLDEPVQFGDCTETISVTDRQGKPLAVDKFGALVRMFTETDPSTAHHLASEVARLAADVNDFGVPGFLAYGSLLGAVRDGKLIGHDTDTDMAYLSNCSQPADIARESFALERFLRGRGWSIERMRIGLFRAVFHDQAGDLRHIDIFLAVHNGTEFFLDRFVLAELPRLALVPLGNVTLEGVQIPAPADPGAVLAATYGPSYLVPDPSFSYKVPRSLRRKSRAWSGGYRLRQSSWQGWLQRERLNRRHPAASAFAEWVAGRESREAVVVDIGCGSGRDALWFARRGHRVVGIDYVDSRLRALTRISEREQLAAGFRPVSLYDVRASLTAGAQLAGDPNDDLVLYSRDLLDVLEPEGRVNFWLLARTALLRRGTLYLKFRVRASEHRAEPGFRPLDPDRIEAEARERGATVLDRQDSRGSTVLVLSWTVA